MAITYHSGERIQGLSTDNAVTTSLSLSELLAYYNFDETSGTVLTNQAGTAGSSDSLGTSVNGTNVGTATVNQTGKIDKTYDFDGSGTGASYDHIAIPNALGTDLAGTNKLSYSLWFNTDEFTNSQGNGWDLIGTYGGTTGADYQGLSINHWYDGNWYIYAEYHGSFSGNAYGGISQANLGTTATGTWYHMVVVYDGTATGNANRLKIYLNGVQKTFDSFSGTIGSTIDYANNPTWIGRPSYGSSYQKNFNGKIDEVTIWKRVLTDSEISALYNSGTGVAVTDAKTATWTMQPTTLGGTWVSGGSAGILSESSGTVTTSIASTDDSNDSQITYDLGAGNVSDSKWILRAKVNLTSSISAPSNACTVSLGIADTTTITGEGETGGNDILTSKIHLQDDTNNTYMVIDSTPTAGSNRYPTRMTTGNIYYVQLQRVSETSFEVKVFSDSTYSTQVGTTSSSSPTTSLTGGRYVFVHFFSQTISSGSATVIFSDLEFYNGVTSIT